MLWLLKGEAFDALSRELCVTEAVLSQWREKFLAGAEANLNNKASSRVPMYTTSLLQNLHAH